MTELPIPLHHPRVFHQKPYWRGDSLAAIRRAKRKGYRYIDQNINLTKGDADAATRANRPVAVVKHWPLIRKDGFSHRVTGTGKKGKEARARHKLGRNARISDLSWSEVSKLRRARGSAKYRTAKVHMQMCADTHIILCAEVKGDPRFGHLKVMQDLRADATATGATVYVMTLQNLGNPLARLKAAKEAGFQTALLPRGKRPANWARDWAPYVDAVWGKWRKS
jgi:hypothetical protein